MRRRLLIAVTVSLTLANSAGAQVAPADPMKAAIHGNWKQVTSFIVAAAEELTEQQYAYRPVPSVRTFGELVGHVAGAQYMMCAAALGEPARAEDAVERAAKTKVALVTALKESTAYCERAYGLSSAALAAQTNLFGQNMTKAHAVALNAVHNGEHYGNMITYMRSLGLVPPSSK